eukprot:413292_1
MSVFVDISLEIASGSIVIDYDMEFSLNVLYENQCFSQLGDGNINGMIGNIQQILWCSWFEACISFAMFVVCIIKIRKWKQNIDDNEPRNQWLFYFSVLG